MARCVAGLLAVLVGLSTALAAEPLSICLEEGSPPYSYKFGERKGGFDLGLAEALAGKLGRELKVVWFETEQDEDEALPWQLNALLSDRRCDLLAGYALFASGLGEPAADRYTLPDYEGKTKADRKRLVTLRPLISTTPYLRTELAVVLAPGSKAGAVTGLGDLRGQRIGVEVTTLAAALLHAYKHGVLTDDVRTAAPNRDLLDRLARDEFDVALIELHKAERHNRRHPDKSVRITDYRHPVGFNLGYAALESSKDLVDDVNAALTALRKDGTLTRIAAAEGISYVAPKPPMVFQRLTPEMLING